MSFPNAAIVAFAVVGGVHVAIEIGTQLAVVAALPGVQNRVAAGTDTMKAAGVQLYHAPGVAMAYCKKKLHEVSAPSPSAPTPSTSGDDGRAAAGATGSTATASTATSSTATDSTATATIPGWFGTEWFGTEWGSGWGLRSRGRNLASSHELVSEVSSHELVSEVSTDGSGSARGGDNTAVGRDNTTDGGEGAADGAGSAAGKKRSSDKEGDDAAGVWGLEQENTRKGASKRQKKANQ